MAGLLLKWVLTPLVLFGAGFAAGWTVHDWKDAGAQLAATRRVVAAVQAQGAINTRAAAADQAAQDQIRTVTRTLIKKVPTHVTPAADARCLIPLGFVRAHDAAASGDLSALSDASGRPDDAPSGVALSAVADTVAQNYGTCRGDARRLSDLQAWVADQQRASR
jgi:hypothetical protein